MTANHWIMLSLLFVVRSAMGLQFQTVGSLGPVLVDALAIDYARLGTLIGLYLLPGVFISLPGGLLSGRFGAKRVLLAGLALMALGGIMTGLLASFPALIVGRVLSGVGAVLMNVVVTTAVTTLFAGREIRTAMGILVSSWPCGLALGLLAFAPLGMWFGWPAAMFAAAAICGVNFVLVLLLYRAPEPDHAAAPAGGRFRIDLSGREWRLVLIAGFVWGIYNVGYIVLLSFLPVLFNAQGYTLAQSNGVVSLLGWALIAMVPLGGYLADRAGRPNTVVVASLVVTAAATMLLLHPPVSASAYVGILLAGGLPAAGIMALPASALRPESRATGMGVYFTCYYGFMAVFPAFAGLLRDLTASNGAPVLFAAASVLAAAAGVIAFRAAFRSGAAGTV